MSTAISLAEHRDFRPFTPFRVTMERPCIVQWSGALCASIRNIQEDAELVSVEKTFRSRRPVTWYRLTTLVRSQLKQQIDGLMQLIDRAGA